MKILIYGAGVLGSLCAFWLHKAGHEVRLLGRGERLVDLRQNGLRLEHALTGQRDNLRVEVVDELNPEEIYDLAMVVMGRHQTASTLPALAANHNIPNVLFIGNNASGAGEYSEALGKERVLLGFVSAGGSIKDGVVWYGGREDKQKIKMVIGEPDGRKSTRLMEIAAALGTSFQCEISPNIDAWLKTHVALILPMAGAVYRAGGNVLALANDKETLNLMARTFKESLDVLKANHLPVLPPVAMIYAWIPAPLLVILFRRVLRTKSVQVAFSHGDHARPEMRLLSEQMSSLIRKTSVPTPALDKLFSVL